MDKKPCNSHDVEVRKGPWTMEEDLILINYIANHGEGVWNSLAKAAGLKRTGKSCRLRWLNYLRPDVRRGNITQEEELLIIELHSKWGNSQLPTQVLLEKPETEDASETEEPQKAEQNMKFRWSKIAKHLPGRTDNEIKNYWRTRIQKHIKQADQATNNYSAQLSNSKAADHQQASTSHVSGGSVADLMDVYSPPSYPCNTVGTFPEQLPMESNEQNYWSLEEFWSMQLFNGD